jgi:hypothetical protein
MIKTKKAMKRPQPQPKNIYLKKNNRDFIPYSYTLLKQNETINEGCDFFLFIKNNFFNNH